MIATQGLTHIHLVVRDLERALRFYATVFGLVERFRDGPTMVFLNTPGSQDLITLNEDPERRGDAGVNGGIAHFGFRLRDSTDLDKVGAIRMCRFACVLIIIVLAAAPVCAAPQWQTLPPTPTLPPATRSGYAPVHGVR